MTRSANVAPEMLKQIEGWTSVASVSEVVEKVLDEQFARRGAVRTYKFLKIAVEGVGGPFQALAINLSRAGMLFRITDPGFAGLEGERQLLPYTSRVWENFNGGLRILLDDGQVAREAELVRVSGYCGEKNRLVLVGCRFRDQLTEAECKLLGIAY